MNYGLSDKVRAVAVERFVNPARESGTGKVSIVARDLMNLLRPAGFPARNWPQICTAIQSGKFLRANGLEIESIEGPPSGQSSNLVIHYRFVNAIEATASRADASPPPKEESPEEWARRMTGKLAGILSEELAEYEGAEGFMRWVRSEDSDQANEDAA
jgi:hypothetical protein